MGKGLTIPLSLDPREWLRGIKVVERSLEDFEGSIEEVEDAGQQLGRKLEDVFDDAARDARQAGDKIGDNLSGGMAGGVDTGFRGKINKTSLGIVGAEIADEFVSSWGEAIRAGNPAEAIYETLTNAGQVLAAALPGAGTVVGMGIATVTGIVQGIREEEQRIRDSITNAIGGASQEVIEAQGYTNATAYVDAVNEVLGAEATKQATLMDLYNVDTFVEALAKAKQEADSVGVASLAVQNIYAGTTDEVESTIGYLEQQKAQTEKNIADLETRLALSVDGGAAEQVLKQELEKENAELQGLIDAGGTRLAQIQTDAGLVEDMATQTRLGADYMNDSAVSAGDLGVNLGTAARNMPDASLMADRIAASAANAERIADGLSTAADRAATLRYWLDQASRIDVRVAGAGSQGGQVAE